MRKMLILLKWKKKEELILLVTSKKEDKTLWYLITSIINHMSSNKEIFIRIGKSYKGSIVFRDDTKAPIMGKGDIFICTKCESYKFISNVYYVPSLKTNILSLGQLLKYGFDTHRKHDSLLIQDEAYKLIAKVSMSKDRMLYA